MLPTTPVAFDPEVVALRLAAQRRRLIGAAIGLVLPLTLGAGLYLYLNSSGGASPEVSRTIVWFVGVSAVISLVLGAFHGLWYWRTSRQRVEPGLAMQLSPMGVEVEGARIPWADVTAMRTGWSRVGDGHTLVIERRDGPPVELPLDSLALLPGSLDSAVRAHSDGRVVLDLTAYGA